MVFPPTKKVVNRKGKLLKHGRLVKNDVNSYSQPLGGGFNHILFSSLFGENYQFGYIIFFKGVETDSQPD